MRVVGVVVSVNGLCCLLGTVDSDLNNKKTGPLGVLDTVQATITGELPNNVFGGTCQEPKHTSTAA